MESESIVNAMSDAQSPLNAWKENALDIYQAQPEMRRDFDAKRATGIADKLASTETGAQIMQWARDHDIEIWMDYQCEEAGAGGYYIPGSKTVCLNAHIEDDQLVMALAHELRHAWQGGNGFCATLYDDIDTYIKQFRFIEADAAAIEVQVCKEWKELNPDLRISPFRQQCLDLAERQKENAPDFLKGKEYLWSGFCGFFVFDNRKDFYDGGSLITGEILAEIKEFDGTRAPTEYAAKSAHKLPEHEGLNVQDKDEFLLLGQMFNGDNYLKDIPIDLLQEDQFVGDLSKSHHIRRDAVKAVEEKRRQDSTPSQKRLIPCLMSPK